MNYKPFGSLPRAEQLELFNAWLDGVEIEGYNPTRAHEGWIYLETPTWYGGFVYRVKPTKPSIDGSAVHPDFKWLARDSDGSGFLYDTAPYPTNTGYWDSAGTNREASVFSSYKPGTCDWEDSLVQRPEGV